MAQFIHVYLGLCNQTGARHELSSEDSQLNKCLHECVSLCKINYKEPDIVIYHVFRAGSLKAHGIIFTFQGE